VQTYVIICYVVVISLFGLCFFCLGWAMWRCWRSRRLLGGLGAGAGLIALLWLGLEIGIVPGSSAYKNYRFSTALFGRNFDLGSVLGGYSSAPAFTGDGTGTRVYHIPEELARWAANPPPEFQTSLPKKQIIPPWKSSIVRWHPTPVSAEEFKLLEPWLGAFTRDRDAETTGRLRRLLQEPGSYVAFEYYTHVDHIGGIRIYLLSPSERILISSATDT